jgi:hypothetical protein
VLDNFSGDLLKEITFQEVRKICYVVRIASVDNSACDTGETKESFCEELKQGFDHFPKYHMKILLGDFNAKVGRQNIFKPTIRSGSLHQDVNDNDVRIVNFATSKNLVVEGAMFAPKHS